MARRISWDDSCSTLTTSSRQKQTERCHPDEVRQFTVREYARIQSFPDEWEFEGGTTSKYKQIGNAVPVKVAEAIGREIIKVLTGQDKIKKFEQHQFNHQIIVQMQFYKNYKKLINARKNNDNKLLDLKK